MITECLRAWNLTATKVFTYNVGLSQEHMMITALATESLELSITDPMQLFNSMDPAPFHERDLDPDVVDYIVEWAQEVAPNAPLVLLVTIKQKAPEYNAGMICDAVHTSFGRRSLAKQRSLKKLLREGRISLIIGICFLAAAIFISDYLGGLISNENYAWLVQESVVIGGWVALWHPLNIFLYDWWPIRAEIRLFDRLSKMEVRQIYTVPSSVPSESGKQGN